MTADLWVNNLIAHWLQIAAIVLAGVGAIVLGRRAIQLKHALQEWGDSLSKGSGPVTIGIPFVPAYLDGMKIGSIDSVRLERHEPHTVDSLRLVVALSDAPAAAQARQCAFELVSFDPGDFKRALGCAADTAGLVPFGRVTFSGGGGAAAPTPRHPRAHEMKIKEAASGGAASRRPPQAGLKHCVALPIDRKA